MNFDMNTVWSRGLELITSNFQLLLVLAAVFLLLPTVALYLLVPDFQAFVDPAADPDVVLDRMGEIAVPLISVGLISTVIQFAGYGAMIALMGDHRPTVGQAIGSGFKIVPSTLAIMVLWMLAYFIGGIVIIIPFSLLAGLSGSTALAVIGFLPVLIFVIWLMARFSMSMPTLVLQPTLNPIQAILNSFKLTGPKQWMILLFWTVVMVIFFVISLLFNGMFGVVAALLGTGTSAMLVLGLANGVTTMASGILICALSVAMYDQLSGASTAKIEETFD